MTASGNKMMRIAGSALLITAAVLAGYLAEPLLVAAPLLLLVVVWLVQNPQILFLILLASIPWSVEFTFAESLGTDLPDEPLMLLMAFTTLALGAASGWQKQGNCRLPLLVLLLLLSFIWTGFSVFYSSYFSTSFKYLLAKGWYLLSFVGAPLALKGGAKEVKKSAVVLFLSMLLATLVVQVKHAGYGFTFASINEAVSPFFRNHVNYSALLVFMVPLLLAFYSLDQNKMRRTLLAFALPVVLAALYFSYARGAWLALLAGLCAYWLIKKGWLVRSYLLFVLLSGLVVLWLSANDRYLAFAPKHDVTIFHENFQEHLLATYQGRDVSTAERFYRWVAGARMSTDNWLTGFGPTTFYQHYKSYTAPVFRTWVSNNPEKSTVHNYFLLLLVEQGLPGLLFFLFLLGVLFWYAQRIYNRPADRFWKTTAATIASLLWMQIVLNSLSDLIETDKVGSVFYLCIAFLLIADTHTKTTNGMQLKSEPTKAKE